MVNHTINRDPLKKRITTGGVKIAKILKGSLLEFPKGYHTTLFQIVYHPW